MRHTLAIILISLVAFSCKNEVKETLTNVDNTKTVVKENTTISGKVAPLLSLDDAVAQAKKENKKVMLFYTGSDWCMPCKLLKKNILSTPEFKKFEEEKLVEIMIDMPAKKKLPEAEVKRNKAIQAKFKPNAVPTIIIVDEEGKKLGEIKGYDAKWTTEEFIGRIEKIIS